MPTIADIAEFLDGFAPPILAEDWDNVGLLVGDRSRDVRNVMTCLTVTPASVREAVDRNADLIVTHHPFPFHGLKRITRDTPEGRMLLDLVAANVAVYSPHTAFDSAATGINQQFAQGLGLANVRPLVEKPEFPKDIDSSGDSVEGVVRLGAGRLGVLSSAQPLSRIVESVKAFLRVEQVKYVGLAAKEIQHVAIACGSAGEFLATAGEVGADCFITGETTFHTCLAAEAMDVALILTGHYASERFAVEELARVLSREFDALNIWACERERDPIQFG